MHRDTRSWPGSATTASARVRRRREGRSAGHQRRVDWFPHLSPDGRLGSSITFPTGTLGHPADLEVEVRVVSTQDWTAPLRRYPLFGGQGTLNVNSWAPDSTRVAFVAYPVD